MYCESKVIYTVHKNTRINRYKLRQHAPLEKGQIIKEIIWGRLDILDKVAF